MPTAAPCNASSAGTSATRPSWPGWHGTGVSKGYPMPHLTFTDTEGQQVTMALSGSQELRSFLAGQMKTWGAVAREFEIKGE
jgi:hypothetical protein